MSSTNGLAPTFATVPVQGSLFAEFDPLDAQMRQIYIADHPLMLATGGYALPTPPIVAVLTQIISSIMAGTPGIAWVAVPRFGKTTAIRLIKEKIGETLNGTPVVVHVARRHAKADEGRFYRELLEASDIAVPPGRDAGERFNRLWKGWWSWVLTRRSKRIALIIDEAQKLSEAEYSWLIDVANILAEKEFRSASCFWTTGTFKSPANLLPGRPNGHFGSLHGSGSHLRRHQERGTAGRGHAGAGR
ncbi:ATP-binding protein [Polaromonas sp. P1(28)-8]|nr:ATP-binding protein [Polaromonas sp. P1(28)-8]